jgi:hypothetical protein
MSATEVHELVDQIKSLDDEDRQLLDALLAKLEDEEWEREAKKARRVASSRGLDQETIDRAVASGRPGTSPGEDEGYSQADVSPDSKPSKRISDVSATRFGQARLPDLHRWPGEVLQAGTSSSACISPR